MHGGINMKSSNWLRSPVPVHFVCYVFFCFLLLWHVVWHAVTCIRSPFAPDPSIIRPPTACTSFLGSSIAAETTHRNFLYKSVVVAASWMLFCGCSNVHRSPARWKAAKQPSSTSKVQSKLLKFLFKVLYAHAMASPATASASSGPHSQSLLANFKGSCWCCCCRCRCCMFALKTHFVCPADPRNDDDDEDDDEDVRSVLEYTTCKPTKQLGPLIIRF